MTDYFVFLRGINVGGHHKVPMEELKRELEAIGCQNVSTVLNSGNVALSSEEKSEVRLEEYISNHLSAVFGFTIPVMARSRKRIKQLLTEQPFTSAPEGSKCLVTFFKHRVSQHESETANAGLKVVHQAPDLVCLYIDLETTGTPEAMKALEEWYGTDITTRTWQTLLKLDKK